MSMFVQSVLERGDIYALAKHAERYEFVRTLSTQQFGELYRLNIAGQRFDDLVDAAIASRKHMENRA